MIRLLILAAAFCAAVTLINHLNPGPGDADVRGPAHLIQPMTTTEIETKAAEVGHSISGLLILAGINRATWWRWKTGKFQPRASSLKRILDILEKP
jgi:hypothetical protein